MQISSPSYTPWQEWEARAYLDEYYSEVMLDDRLTLQWLVELAPSLASVPVALDFGCGPTVQHLFPLAHKAAQFHLCDYVSNNINAVRAWQQREPDAHDWLPFALETLRLEGIAEPSEAQARSLEDAVRRRISWLTTADAGQTDPLGPEKRGFYPLVTSHYCAEGATNDKETWQLYMRNIAGLVAPGGTFIVSACGSANFYRVGQGCFPCAGVSGQDVLVCLQSLGFGDVDVRVRLVPSHEEQGYGSVILARAIKR